MLGELLKKQGEIGIQKVKSAIAPFSATRETEESIRFESTETTLKIFAREFIEAMETGRGPRQSSTDGGFKDKMLDYMQARGIGSELDQKSKERLAKFLVLKINRDGDKLWKKGGGRDVYSKAVEEFTEELMEVVAKHELESFSAQVSASLKGID